MSNAKDDLPEPDSPVITISLFLGMTTSIFFKLWSFAPFIIMFSFGLTSEISLLMYQLILAIKILFFKPFYKNIY